MNVEIKKLSREEIGRFVELIQVFERVFEMRNFTMPGRNHIEQLLQGDNFLVFVGLDDDKVIGGLTAYVMEQYYSAAPLVYIYDLAVETNYQRKGIGRALIEHINSYCKKAGVEAVMVEAEEPDEYAIEFYRSTGATGKKTVHFEYLQDNISQ